MKQNTIYFYWSVIGSRVDYQAWQEFCCVCLELMCHECLGQSGIWARFYEGCFWEISICFEIFLFKGLVSLVFNCQIKLSFWLGLIFFKRINFLITLLLLNYFKTIFDSIFKILIVIKAGRASIYLLPLPTKGSKHTPITCL